MAEQTTTIELSAQIKKLYPEFSLALIEDLLLHGKLKTMQSGELIMDVGSHINEVPLILKGRIKVFRPHDDGHELFLYYLGIGDACAISLACSSGNQRISRIRAEAVEPCLLFAFPVRFMDEWMLKHRTWYYYVLNTYRFRFEEILKSLDSVAFYKLDERVEQYLKLQKEQTKNNKLEITHQEIAMELNSSREVISRILKKMENNGKIEMGRNHIEILF
jgi:CRP/FNR family transcriptional regulator, anaerobic regulatory protein